MKPIYELLAELGACSDALDAYYVPSALPHAADYERFWNECTRADWLLWIAERLGVEQRVVAKAVLLVVETVAKAKDISVNVRVKRALADFMEYGTYASWIFDELAIREANAFTCAMARRPCDSLTLRPSIISSCMPVQYKAKSELCDAIRSVIPYELVRKALAPYL